MKNDLMSLVMLISAALSGQDTQGSRPPNSMAAPNAWMKIPTDVTIPDTAPPAVRVARDSVFDSIHRFNPPLTPESAQRFVVSEGVTSESMPEIPDLAGQALVIGTFVAVAAS